MEDKHVLEQVPTADQEPIEGQDSHSTDDHPNQHATTFMPIVDDDDKISTKHGSFAHGAQMRRRDSRAAAYGEIDHAELERVATALSRRRSTTTGENIAGIESVLDNEDPRLDPSNKAFNLEKWLKTFIQQFQEEGVTSQELGVSWRNLTVSGTGAAIQLQGTVGGMLAAPFRLGELFSFGKKQSKTILHSFNGIMKPGELLIVLGRPGSGCSTMLKTMCGELKGLQLEDGSIIRYNGIEQKQMVKEFKGETTYNQEVRVVFTS
jgi:ATP-binding cassette subfamily G (WHITE) protein 2 (PDR)